MTSSVARVGAVFSPGSRITDPRRLFGRRADMAALMTAFEASSDNVPVLAGPPGIGKSSLLAMLEHVLRGNVLPLRLMDLDHLAPSEINRLVVPLRMSDRIVDEDRCVAEMRRAVSHALGKAPKHFALKGVEVEAGVSFAKAKATWERSNADAPPADLDLLLAHIDEVLDTGPVEQVVFIFDECEQVTWGQRLMEFTQEFESPLVRFCLATRDIQIHRLASSTRGDYRWIKHVPVGPLSGIQIQSVFDDAIQQLADMEIYLRLSPDAFAYIIEHAAGEPWYCHLVGEQLVLGPSSVIEAGWKLGERAAITVRRQEVVEAERMMLESRLLGINADRYRALVRNAPAREELIRTLAQYPSTHIPVDFIRFLANRRGRHFARTLARLTERTDPILAEVPGSLGWRFVEHQFRVYCRLAPALYEGAEELARSSLEAWSWRG